MTEALQYVEANVNHCTLTYGVLPCRAQLGFADESSPVAASFNGTNDYLTRGANLTGMADAKTGALSLWLNMQDGDGVEQVIFTTTNGRFTLRRLSTNLLQLVGRNAANTVIMSASTSGTVLADTGWRHVLMSWDLAAAAIQIYVDNVSVASIATNTNDTIDYTDTDFAVGALVAGTSKLTGILAELWLNNSFIDFSVEASRREFLSAHGRPVALGATGQIPTGSVPILYLANPIASWQTNLGTGGGLTENGALEEGTFATGTRKCFNSIATCQDRESFTNDPVTYRFASPTHYLPANPPALPCIVPGGVDYTPAVLKPGENIGERATLSITFEDFKHDNGGPSFEQVPQRARLHSV